MPDITEQLRRYADEVLVSVAPVTAEEAMAIPGREAPPPTARRRVASVFVAVAVVLVVAATTGTLWWANRDGGTRVEAGRASPGNPPTGPEAPSGRLRPSPPDASWRAIAAAPAAVRSGDTAEWTGAEMVVLASRGAPAAAAYNPSSDSWRALPPPPIAARSRALVEWTGRELLVWGGFDPRYLPLADGAAYDPAADRWRTLAPPPPSLTAGVASVWTGREVIVWGGDSAASPGAENLASAAAYDPAADRWRALPPPPVGLSYASGAWTGRQAIFWGGVVRDRSQRLFVGTAGARLDPAVGVWEALPPSGLDAQASVAVWTGEELLAWSYVLEARAFDPRSGRWRTIRDVGLEFRECYSTGTAVRRWALVWYCDQAALYGPDGRTSDLPPPPIGRGVALWTGRDVLLWGTAARTDAATAAARGVTLTLEQ